MSTDLAISMDELEMESAELLPSRETLCVPKCHHHQAAAPAAPSYSLTYVLTQVASNQQTGLLNISLLSGDIFN